MRVSQDAARRGLPFDFYFSPSPDPVPRFWEEIRKGFPPSHNRLLEYVLADWFPTRGWFAASGQTTLERRTIERAVAEIGPAGDALRRELDALAQQNAPPQHPRWLDLCVKAAEFRTALLDVRKLQQAVRALDQSFPETYSGRAFLARLDEHEQALIRKVAGRFDPQDAATRELLAELPKLQRQMLVDANPLLKGAKLLFVKRYTYDSMHYYDDFYNGLREFGGSLCILSLSDGTVTEVAPQLRGGIFDRYDLSFDAKRILFGYRRPKPEGFRIHEIGVDGTGLRQITFPAPDEKQRVARSSQFPPDALDRNPLLYGHWTDDMHPCYLPDGSIVFASSRCEGGVLCGDHSLSTTRLYRVNADGSGLHPISSGALSEFTPTMLDDGRILYNRWEYVNKGVAAIQPLWAMRPDGSASEEVYGGNIANPAVFVQARPIPGRPNLVVCSGVGHEPLSVGTLLLLDLHKDKRTTDVMTRLTPDTDVRGLRGLYQRRNGEWRADDIYGPFYCDPYPLSDKFFLVVCNPDKRYNHRTAYGIYLLDVFGNRVPVYTDPAISCWQPMLLKPRPVPPVLAPAAPAQTAAASSEATLLVMDVYQGLPGLRRGDVKYIRVMEQIPRPWSAWQHRPEDGISGQMVAISWFTHIWVAVLHGVVPVHEDGSAYFTVPAGRSIYFQALDESFMEVQRMRTFVSYQPGESRSCIGCHEHRKFAPPNRPPIALIFPPAKPGPQPGEVAPRPLHYAADVQPILDKHCVRCHSTKDPQGGLDLSGELTTHFNRSYEQLLQKKLVNTIREWTGPDSNGAMSNAEAVPPYTYGSHKSKLIDVLRKGHYGVTPREGAAPVGAPLVGAPTRAGTSPAPTGPSPSPAKLSREEFVKLVTWVDTNAPYYGSYFGRRNLQYKGHPDFRPVPTLASAMGIPPEPQKLKLIPARLVGWWPLDERAGETAADASGNGHPGKVVGAAWTPEGRIGGAMAFDGKGYVEVGDLGSFDAISVAAWVKTRDLRNTWNPLLFTQGWQKSSFHFSLLRDGLVNVAINPGGSGAIHRHSNTAVADGQWHHIAVVCDARAGGDLRFYVDGKQDAEVPLDCDLPLLLDGFRLGSWSGWQGIPDNNFHGLLDDVRVFRGMLTDQEVARLAAMTRVSAP